MSRNNKNSGIPASGGQFDRRVFMGGLTAVAALAGASRQARAADALPANPGESQAPPLKDLAGKVAYISGASSGIGLATARVLREAGMKVVIGYIMDDQI